MQIEGLDKDEWEDEIRESAKGEYRPLKPGSDEYDEVLGNMKLIIGYHGPVKVRDFLRTRFISPDGKARRGTFTIEEEKDDFAEELSCIPDKSNGIKINAPCSSTDFFGGTAPPPEKAPVVVAEDLMRKHEEEYQDLFRELQVSEEAKKGERMEELDKLESNEDPKLSKEDAELSRTRIVNRHRNEDAKLSKDRWAKFNCMVMLQLREFSSMQEQKKWSKEAPGEDQEQRKERVRREKLFPARFLAKEERAEQERLSEIHKLWRKNMRKFDMADSIYDLSMKDDIVKPTLERLSLVSQGTMGSGTLSFGASSMMMTNFPLLRIPVDKKNLLRVERQILEHQINSMVSKEEPMKSVHHKSQTQDFAPIAAPLETSLAAQLAFKQPACQGQCEDVGDALGKFSATLRKNFYESIKSVDNETPPAEELQDDPHVPKSST